MPVSPEQSRILAAMHLSREEEEYALHNSMAIIRHLSGVILCSKLRPRATLAALADALDALSVAYAADLESDAPPGKAKTN